MKLWYDNILHYFVIFLVFVCRERNRESERKRESERARERARQTDRQTHPPTAKFIYIIMSNLFLGRRRQAFYNCFWE
jgi:hypothetical protein